MLILWEKPPVTVSVKERSLKSVLTDILSKRNLQYQVSGNKILITVSSVQTPKSTGKKKLAELLLMKEANLLSVSIFQRKERLTELLRIWMVDFLFKVGNNSSLLVSYIGYDGQKYPLEEKTSLILL